MEAHNVAVIGLGYVGLPFGSLLANSGFNVIGVDINDEILEKISRGESHLKEPGLSTLVEAAVNSNRLKVTKDTTSAVKSSDVVVICVQTPLIKEKPDLKYLYEACGKVANGLSKGKLILIESTIPPLTTKKIAEILNKSKIEAGNDFYLAYCPERILPGNTLHELVYNDRIIGGITEESSKKAEEFYRKFVKGAIYTTDSPTAEMVKLMENTFRDVNIALANQFALICEQLGVDVYKAIALANKHPRVNIHQPGAGVGGHCIPKDPWLMVSVLQVKPELIINARKINDYMPVHMIELLKSIKKDLKKVVVFGIAYKSASDDTRNSPGLEIVKNLSKECEVEIYDPYSGYSDIEVVRDSDAIIIATDHPEFRELDFKAIKRIMKTPIIIDGRNLLSSKIEDIGFIYKGCGKG